MAPNRPPVTSRWASNVPAPSSFQFSGYRRELSRKYAYQLVTWLKRAIISGQYYIYER